MSTKELALQTIQELPNTASWDEIEERIHFLAAIERGREEIRSGKIISHEKVMNQRFNHEERQAHEVRKPVL